MALRIEKTTLSLIVLLTPAAWGADYAARHRHTAGSCGGTLRVEPAGIVYLEQTAHQHHRWSWAWDDVQRLEVGDDGRVQLVTYRDRALLAGRDQRYEFEVKGELDLKALRQALGARLEEHVADAQGAPLWALPAKRLGAVRGSQGELRVYADRVVYYSAAPGESRTWRDREIEFVTSDGPYSLSLTAGKTHTFQLKQPLSEADYLALWRRLTPGVR